MYILRLLINFLQVEQVLQRIVDQKAILAVWSTVCLKNNLPKGFFKKETIVATFVALFFSVCDRNYYVTGLMSFLMR